MRTIEFLKTVRCEHQKFEAGDVVTAGRVPADHLETCLRLGHAREIEPGETVLMLPLDASPDDAHALNALASGRYLTVPSGPTEDDMRSAVAEIERLRQLAGQRAEAIDAANVEIRELKAANTDMADKLRDATLLLEAVKKPTAAASTAVEDEHPQPPEPDDKPSGAKPPVVGSSKPPELKGGKK